MARGRIIYKGSPAAKTKALPKIFKEVNKLVVLAWHERFLAAHFREGAGQVYKYTSRDEGYRRRKARIHGHRRPLVWTGESRRRAMSRFRVTSTSKKGTGVFSLPWYFTRQSTSANQPDKAAELTKVTRREFDMLENLYENIAMRKVRAVKRQERKTIR